MDRRNCPVCGWLADAAEIDRLTAQYPEHVCPRCQGARLVEFDWLDQPEPDHVAIEANV